MKTYKIPAVYEIVVKQREKDALERGKLIGAQMMETEYSKITEMNKRLIKISKECLLGWKRCGKEWGKSNDIWLVISLLAYFGGLLLGIAWF